MKNEFTKNIKIVPIKANYCPTCGCYPKITPENCPTKIECPICGQSVTKTFFGINHATEKTLLTYEWNKDTFRYPYSDYIAQRLGVNDDDYLVFDMRTLGFMKGFNKISEALDYMREVYKSDHTLRTEVHQLTPEGYLVPIVDSNLLSMIEEGWEGYSDLKNHDYYLILGKENN